MVKQMFMLTLMGILCFGCSSVYIDVFSGGTIVYYKNARVQLPNGDIATRVIPYCLEFPGGYRTRYGRPDIDIYVDVNGTYVNLKTIQMHELEKLCHPDLCYLRCPDIYAEEGRAFCFQFSDKNKMVMGEILYPFTDTNLINVSIDNGFRHVGHNGDSSPIVQFDLQTKYPFIDREIVQKYLGPCIYKDRIPEPK